MTEAEWLACDDPTKMLRFLTGKTSERKLRLFAVACCRNIWHLLSDERSRNAVDVAERFADGMATEVKRKSAQTAAKAAIEALYPAHDDYAALAIANATAEDASAAINADATAYTAAEAVADADDPTGETQRIAERLWQRDVLLDIFGNPFRPVSLNSTWLTSTVRSLAQAIYVDRQLPSGNLDSRRMVLLGDALEEAGCPDPEILSHCRQQRVHVRGCWVMDLILGKK